MSVNNKIVTTYAKSLFQNRMALDLAASKKRKGSKLPNVAIVGEELILIGSVLVSSKKLKSFFSNPTYLEQQKLDIILTVFSGLTPYVKSFLKVLTEKSHLSLLPEISNEYANILLKFKNTTKVKLIVASPLEENFGPSLLKTLRNLTKSKDIILTGGYDPKLLGGFILEYNSMAIDASVLKEFSLFFTEM
jgi:F-type H+-transporting ATPase subunit delta